ncbi:DUF4363 family protein [Bacillus marinisedimentorum]|uniref:DUF4363 family protein n=1 Tax=Bacillus marinisedimentorum TaxID=1821260 RepID=UPI0008730186|nr:DUF4363 family protein [Bacillus marinisedimentorum]
MYKVIPIIVLIGSALFLASGGWLKEPFGEHDRVEEAVRQTELAIEKKDWEEASRNLKKAEKAWDKVANRVQFSVERQYMYDIGVTLARLKGNIKAEDRAGALAETETFYLLWEELGK